MDLKTDKFLPSLPNQFYLIQPEKIKDQDRLKEIAPTALTFLFYICYKKILLSGKKPVTSKKFCSISANIYSSRFYF